MRKKHLRAALAEQKRLYSELETSYQVLLARQPQQDNAKKFTPEEADEIRHIHEFGKHTLRELAEILGVHPSTISRIVNRKAYR